VVREYEQNVAETLWICLDTRGEAGDEAETAVETAAALAAGAYHAGKRFGFSTPRVTIEPGQGPGHLERVLDALARVEFAPGAPSPLPPVDPSRCVLVTAHATGGLRFGEVILPSARPPGGEILRRGDACAPGDRGPPKGDPHP